MAVISTLAVNIIAKTAGFTRGVRSTRASMNKFNSTIQNTKRLLTGLIVGTGVIRGFRSLLRVASEVTETMSKFNVVFAELAVGAKKWATDFADAVGRSRKDVLSWAAELQDIFVPMGFAREEAAKFSKSLVQLGVDVASFNEKVDREVMRNFTSAIMGSHRAVRQYGIAISESRIQQAAYNEGLNKSFSNLNDMEKVFLRYRIIVNDTKDAQTDAIRTQDNYANQLKRMRASVTNLAAEIGEKMLPVMVGVLKTVRNLVNVFRDMSAETIRNMMSLARMAISFGAFLILVPKIVAAIKGIVKAYQALAVGQSIVQALGGPAGWAMLAAGAVIAAAAVISVNLAFDDLIRNMDTLSKETGEFKASGDLIKVTMDDIRGSLMMAGKPGTGVIPVIRKLRDEIAKLRYTERQLAEFDLQKALGGVSRLQPGMMGILGPFTELDRLLDTLEELKRNADLTKAGQDLFTQMMTPLEKYEAKLTLFDTLLQKNKITWDTYGRAIRAARGELEGVAGAGSFAGPGTAKVIRESLVSVSGLAMGTKDPALSKMDLQLHEAQESNAWLAKIAQGPAARLERPQFNMPQAGGQGPQVSVPGLATGTQDPALSKMGELLIEAKKQTEYQRRIAQDEGLS